MGKKAEGWQDVEKIVRNKHFIPEILQFATNRVSCKVRKRFMKKYLSDSSWEFERVNKYSTVAGSLLLWANAQIKFSSWLDEIEPITREIKSIQSVMHGRGKQREALVTEYEKEIEESRFDYH